MDFATRSRDGRSMAIKGRHLTLLAAAALAGCGSGGNSSSGPAAGTPAKAANGQAATIAAEKSPLGQILDDSKGRTVYLFKKDQGPTSACTGACAAAWPPVLVHSKPVTGTGANASLV